MVARPVLGPPVAAPTKPSRLAFQPASPGPSVQLAHSYLAVLAEIRPPEDHLVVVIEGIVTGIDTRSLQRLFGVCEVTTIEICSTWITIISSTGIVEGYRGWWYIAGSDSEDVQLAAEVVVGSVTLWIVLPCWVVTSV